MNAVPGLATCVSSQKPTPLTEVTSSACMGMPYGNPFLQLTHLVTLLQLLKIISGYINHRGHFKHKQSKIPLDHRCGQVKGKLREPASTPHCLPRCGYLPPTSQEGTMKEKNKIWPCKYSL